MPRLHGFREPPLSAGIRELRRAFHSWLHALIIDLGHHPEINGLTLEQLYALDLAGTWALFIAHERYNDDVRAGYWAECPLGKRPPAGLLVPAIARVVDLTDKTVDWSVRIPPARVVRLGDRSAA